MKTEKTCAYCGHKTARFAPSAEGSMVAPSCPACGLPMDPPPDAWFNEIAPRAFDFGSLSIEKARILIGEVARLRDSMALQVAELTDYALLPADE